MPVNFVNIPDVLKQSASFCVWKMEKRSGRPTKVPYNPRTGAMAKTNDPSTFADFNTAMKSYAIGGWDGIGYRVSEGIGAIDIDHCIREDGSLNDVAASILGIFSTAYFERSPSGTGLRGFFKLSPDFAYDKTVYYINNRKHGLEVYLPGTTNRFVTVTGDMFRNGAVTRNDDALRTLLDTFMKRSTRVSSKTVEPASYLDDEGVISHASASESGDKFKALYAGNWEEGYDSQSDADMALVSILAFWCGNVEEQIDRIFRTSGLFRDKWDRQTGDSTYGQITIRNAVSTNDTIYTPIRDSESAENDFTDLDEQDTLPSFEPDLSKTFNRGFTELYIDGRRGKWASLDAPKSMGERLGAVSRVRPVAGGIEVTVPGASNLRNGDGFAFVLEGEIVGFRGDVCEGNRIICKPVRGLKAGVELWRNISVDFEKSLEANPCRRFVGVGLAVAATGSSISVSATAEDGRIATVSLEGCDAARDLERAATLISGQLSKHAEHYSFGVTALDSSDGLPHLSAAALNGLRRELASQLDAQAVHAIPMATSAGGHTVAPEALSTGRRPGELMRSKYCIRYELGICPVHQQDSRQGLSRDAERPAALRGVRPSDSLCLVNNGRRFPLLFDCKACEMAVLEGA